MAAVKPPIVITVGPAMAVLIGLTTTALIADSMYWGSGSVIPASLGGTVTVNKYTPTTDSSGAAFVDIQYIRSLDVFCVSRGPDSPGCIIITLATPISDVPNGTFKSYEPNTNNALSPYYGIVLVPRDTCLNECTGGTCRAQGGICFE